MELVNVSEVAVIHVSIGRARHFPLFSIPDSYPTHNI
jgi:hypothetical protein